VPGGVTASSEKGAYSEDAPIDVSTSQISVPSAETESALSPAPPIPALLLTRLRIRRSDDPVETGDYWLGRKVWHSGADVDAPVAATSFALKYGWSGHNHLGFTDAWGLSGASDEALPSAFDAPDSIRNDSAARRQWLTFVRPNAHATQPSVDGPTAQPDAGDPPPGMPEPAPTPAPAPQPEPQPCNILDNRAIDINTEGWVSYNADIAVVPDAHSGPGALTLRAGSARIIGTARASTGHRISGHAKPCSPPPASKTAPRGSTATSQP